MEPIFHLLSKDFLPIGLETPAVLKLDQIGLKSGRWWASPKKVERPKRPWKECREETRCKAEGGFTPGQLWDNAYPQKLAQYSKLRDAQYNGSTLSFDDILHFGNTVFQNHLTIKLIILLFIF